MLKISSISCANALPRLLIASLILLYSVLDAKQPEESQFLLSTSQHKFAYPLTTTYIQLGIVYLFLFLTAILSICLAYVSCGTWFKSRTAALPTADSEDKSDKVRSKALSQSSIWRGLCELRLPGTEGYQFARVKRFLALAVVYTVETVLNNHLIAYTDMPLYRFSRILSAAIGVMYALVTSYDQHTSSSIATASVATLNMVLLQVHIKTKYPFETIVLAAFASTAMAIYPGLLLRTYKNEVADLAEQRNRRERAPLSATEPIHQDRLRACWNVLYYSTLLSLLILTPLWLMSGDITHIAQNYYYITEREFYLDALCGGIFSWAAICATLALVVVSSPLMALFLVVPKVALEMWLCRSDHLTAHSSIRLIVCSVSCIWFLARNTQLQP